MSDARAGIKTRVDFGKACVFTGMTVQSAHFQTAGPFAQPRRLECFVLIAHWTQMAEREDQSLEGGERGRELNALRDPLIGYFRRRISDQDDVQDLVQEVFLRLSARRADDSIDNLRGYVFQVAASVLADRGRRRAVRHQDVHVELDLEREASSDFAPDRIAVGRESLKAVYAILQSLPERTRTIFVLRRLEGLSYRDIAGRLGISVSAVEKHMVRATERLTRLGDLR